MPVPDEEGRLNVEVVLATATQNWCVELDLEEESTVSLALERAFATPAFNGAKLVPFDAISVWGRLVSQDYALKDQDRLELLRKLPVDPLSRRRRLSKHP